MTTYEERKARLVLTLDDGSTICAAFLTNDQALKLMPEIVRCIRALIAEDVSARR